MIHIVLRSDGTNLRLFKSIIFIVYDWNNTSEYSFSLHWNISIFLNVLIWEFIPIYFIFMTAQCTYTSIDESILTSIVRFRYHRRNRYKLDISSWSESHHRAAQRSSKIRTIYN